MSITNEAQIKEYLEEVKTKLISYDVKTFVLIAVDEDGSSLNNVWGEAHKIISFVELFKLSFVMKNYFESIESVAVANEDICRH